MEILALSNPLFAKMVQEQNGGASLDDEMSKRYAKKLGIKDASSVPQFMHDDGLGFLFEGPDGLKVPKFKGDMIDNMSDDELDLGQDDGSDENTQIEEESEDEDSDDGDQDSKQEDQQVDNDYSDSSENKSESSSLKNSETNPSSSKEAPAKYIPPQLRKTTNAPPSVSGIKVKRQLLGLLNRLGDSNLESIVKEIEGCLRNGTRNDVTTELTALILAHCADPSLNMLDSFSCIHAALVSAMSYTIGNDFAAYFIQTLVEQFESHRTLSMQESTSPDSSLSKRCANLATLMAYCCNFGIVSTRLLYDIIRQCVSGGFRELDTDVLLRILKVSGSHLRSQDPTSLKEIVLLVQDSVQKITTPMTPRCKYMIESISDLKNNKRKRSGADGTSTELLFAKLKKFISNLGRSGMRSEPLGVGLQDIRDVPTKGRWWVVGAAWAGREVDDAVVVGEADNVLMQLARKMGLNTDVRRGIFVVLMSSQDCMDAFERLNRLSLKEKQQREIVRVLVQCCVMEDTFNMFYPLVASRFCDGGFSYKITFQFVIWDAIKEMGESNAYGVRKAVHLAKMCGVMVCNGTVGLSLLKVLTFTELSPLQILFCRMLFGHILSHKTRKGIDPDAYLLKVFALKEKKKDGGSDLTVVKDGILFFVNKYVTVEKKEFFNNVDVEVVRRRTKLVKSILGQ